MSGVWVFKNGVIRLIENPTGEPTDCRGNVRRKVLFYVPTEEVVTSHHMLEQKLAGLGWERYRHQIHADPNLVQFHRQSSIDLISLPSDFRNLTSVHMYDIVVKCRNAFEVRDIVIQ